MHDMVMASGYATAAQTLSLLFTGGLTWSVAEEVRGKLFGTAWLLTMMC